MGTTRHEAGLEAGTRDEEWTIGGQTGGRGDFARGVNVGPTERAVTMLAGAGLLVYGLARGVTRGWLPALTGAALVWRGVTGTCAVYRLLGIDRVADRETVAGNLGVKVERSIVVDAPPARLYGAWRTLENLPRVMSHVSHVEQVDPTRSRWTVKLPGGLSIGWDAEIINDVPGELIAWRSLGRSLVRHAGSVRFERAPDGQATLVRVSLQYDPPAGKLGHTLLGLLGQNADEQIAADLVAFKRAIESGAHAA